MTDAFQDQAAGGKPPAALVQGPNWRERLDRPVYSVRLWPNQSLTRTGLKSFFGVSGAMLCLPLMAVAGTPVFWGLLPFILAALGAAWWAIRRNGRNLDLHETVSIWRDEVRVEHVDPRGRIRRWQADPMRARVRLHEDARIEDYLTMTGGGREIELGAFLAPEERVALAGEIERALTRAIRGDTL